MKGYKSFKRENGKLKCEDVEYEIGGTYEVKPKRGRIKVCNIGIQYYTKIECMLNYHLEKEDLIICEIEDVGDQREVKKNKISTNKIKIIKEINKDEYPFKCDERGNIIYEKDHKKNEYFWVYKYDEKGNMIYEKDSCGYEYFWVYKYDEKGNMIYKKDSDGIEYFWKYDEKGKLIRRENNKEIFEKIA